MTNEIYPCLWFNGNAKEAADFYCNIFPNSVIKTNTPMVVLFELNGKKIMGLNGGPMFTMNPSISMFVHCASLDECKRLWDQLLEGGKVMMALDKYPWSEQYGWLQDKFGFTWQIMKAEKDKMMPSLLFTGDKFGRAEEAMDLYTKIFSNSAVETRNKYGDDSPFAGKIAYGEFKLDGYPMVAMDGPGEHKFVFSEGISLVVNCADQQEIDHFWNNFTADGGAESMCGWCRDKFGVSWQIVPSNIGQLINGSEKGQRAMQKMLKMKKMDIAELEGA